MKSIISKAVVAAIMLCCLTLGLRAKPANHPSTNAIALSDTGKMAKSKMKMKKKKMSKMSNDKMKMDKKMAKDSAGKM